MIKGKYPCKKVIGYDANSLYLDCLGLSMPTGYYTFQEEKNNYRKGTRCSRESIQWLEHVMRAEGPACRKLIRIGNVSVDGYDESTRTVYEYHCCFWHGHLCHSGYDSERWNATLERENSLRELGYSDVSITSCEWMKMPESKVWYSLTNDEDSASTSTAASSMEDILDDIVNDRIFGFAKVNFQRFSKIWKLLLRLLATTCKHTACGLVEK